jgi:sugar phosphate isomerase/epimerase
MFKNLSPGAISIRSSWLHGLELAQQAGFGGAELNLAEAMELASERGTEWVRHRFIERKLKIGGWGLPVNWRGTEQQFREGLAKLPAAAQLAHDLGCHRTTTVVLGWSDELTRQEHFEMAKRRLRLICEVLRHYGHSLGLEFIGPRTSRAPHKYGFAYTMDGMLTLCCAIGTPNVGLLFDVWHWYTCGSTLDDVRHLRKEDVVYVHINDAPSGVDVLDQIDNQRCLPGETGVIPNRELLTLLKEIGYDGPVTAEPFSAKLKAVAEQDPLEAAQMTSRALDSIWDWSS